MSSSTLVPIVIKHGSTTYHIHLENSPDDNKRKQFELISQQIRIPTDRLKLIYKGKRFTEQNWHETVLVPNMIFLSIGEQNEDESDLNAKDIDCIVHQLKVDRNAAIRALKLHPDVVDAILYLGNKWTRSIFVLNFCPPNDNDYFRTCRRATVFLRCQLIKILSLIDFFVNSTISINHETSMSIRRGAFSILFNIL